MAEHNARRSSRDGRAYVVERVGADGKRSKVAVFRDGRKGSPVLTAGPPAWEPDFQAGDRTGQDQPNQPGGQSTMRIRSRWGDAVPSDYNGTLMAEHDGREVGSPGPRPLPTVTEQSVGQRAQRHKRVILTSSNDWLSSITMVAFWERADNLFS
jgi:hypothetical protein